MAHFIVVGFAKIIGCSLKLLLAPHLSETERLWGGFRSWNLENLILSQYFPPLIGWKITVDNFFTSVPQVEKLKLLTLIYRSPTLTCYVDIDGGEGRQRNRGHVLDTNPEGEEASRLVVEVLCHQDGRRTVHTVGLDVEPNRHIGLWHLTLL